MTLWLAALAVLGMVSDVSAATVHVYPGVGVVQAAIDAASPGDRLVLHPNPDGTNAVYAQAITVTKPLRILGRGGTKVILSAACSGAVPVTVAADGVLIAGLVVHGASGTTAIDVQDRDDVRLNRVFVAEVVGGVGCTPTLAMVNVERSTHVRIRGGAIVRDATAPYGIPGIRLAEIAAGGEVHVAGVEVAGDPVVLVADSGAGAGLGEARIAIVRGRFQGLLNTGVLVQNSDGLRVLGVEFIGATPFVHLDSQSNNNLVANNSFGSGDGVDEGTGNCWRGNTSLGGTSLGCP